MPTGYTAGIANGTVTDLRTFALRCARGMGALVTMSDMPLNAPIPDRFEPSDYHRKKLAEVKAERHRICKLSDDECQIEAKAEYDAECDSIAKYSAEEVLRRERYERMMSDVEKWEGSPEGLKPFMLDQLRESVRFDCGGYVRPSPVLMSGPDWRASKLEKLHNDIQYHAAEHAKEVERVELRNAWVAQLMAALPPS